MVGDDFSSLAIIVGCRITEALAGATVTHGRGKKLINGLEEKEGKILLIKDKGG